MLEQAIQQGIAPAIVVAIYLIVIKVIDAKKNSHQVELQQTLVSSINSISVFLEQFTKHIIDKDKEKCRNTIKDAFKCLQGELMFFFAQTIINNNVDVNRNNIIANSKGLIYSNFNVIKSKISLYKINGYIISDYIQKEWRDELEKDIIDFIYMKDYDKEHKILAYRNKLDITIKTYVSSILENIKE